MLTLLLFVFCGHLSKQVCLNSLILLNGTKEASPITNVLSSQIPVMPMLGCIF